MLYWEACRPYFLFHDSPARQTAFTNITGVLKYPQHFCDTGTPWLEDIKVAETAILLWPHIRKYVEATMKLPCTTIPSWKSFQVVREATKDKLVLARLHAFMAVGNILQEFLTHFQWDEPRSPFLFRALTEVMERLHEKIVKRAVLSWRRIKHAKLILRRMRIFEV